MLSGLLWFLMAGPKDFFIRNMQYAKPAKSYQTDLPLMDQVKFLYWAQKNQVPYDPSPTADYDMQGFYKALQDGDPRATSAVNPNDGRMHYPDYWKTPYHESFSKESQWATPYAPSWNDQDQLVSPDGRVVFDERAKSKGLDLKKLLK